MARYCKCCGIQESSWVLLNENTLCRSCAASSKDAGKSLSVRGKRNTSLSINGTSVIIKSNRDEVIIPIKNIQELKVVSPQNFFHGAIEMKTAKAPDASVRIGGGISFLSNTLTFYLLENSEMVAAKNVQAYVMNFSEVPTPEAISNADEIKKYKELLDIGAITQEEFDTKKKQLLNL